MPIPEVRVVARNLRWEVSTRGIIRPLVDWLCTRERAIEHAFDRAREIDVKCVVVARLDGTIEEVIPVRAVEVVGF